MAKFDVHLLSDQPRAIVVSNTEYCLRFQHCHPSPDAIASSSEPDEFASPQDFVDISTRDPKSIKIERTIKSDVQGILGLIYVDGDIFLSVVKFASQAATLEAKQKVLRLISVAFISVNSGDYDQPSASGEEDVDDDDVIADGGNLMDHPCRTARQYLQSGRFYASTGLDLIQRLQTRFNTKNPLDDTVSKLDYLWNTFMLRPFLSYRSHLDTKARNSLDSSNILLFAIRGFASTMTIPPVSTPLKTQKEAPSLLTIVSRTSRYRAGVNSRVFGIDDDGHAAGFVETEIIYGTSPGIFISFVQIRGSVPIFWEMAFGRLGVPKARITRSPQPTQSAFKKHFEKLKMEYGGVHIVSLLSAKENDQSKLLQAYSEHARTLQQVSSTIFDYKRLSEAGSGLEGAFAIWPHVEHMAKEYSYFMTREVTEPQTDQTNQALPITSEQKGVFRVNCMNCLDSTNLVQTCISQRVLESFFERVSLKEKGDFWLRHSTLWADNGDALAKLYTGAGALKSSYARTGKVTLAGALSDARKTMTRAYHSNFADKATTQCIDFLLGQLDRQTIVVLHSPTEDNLKKQLALRSGEYTNFSFVKIWAGTLTLTGVAGQPILQDRAENEITIWTQTAFQMDGESPSVIALGLQETSEIYLRRTDREEFSKNRAWRSVIKNTINDLAGKRGLQKYRFLISENLAGIVLFVFVRTDDYEKVVDIKTGRMLVTRRGAVAVRFTYFHSSICLVNSQFTNGGFADYEERDREFKSISEGLRFEGDSSIQDHDTVIWLGNLSYQIGLSRERVETLIQQHDYESLYENDQAVLHMPQRTATNPSLISTKPRNPAWRGRIVHKGSSLRQLYYDSVPVRLSQHRPIYKILDWRVPIVDEIARDMVLKSIVEQKERGTEAIPSERLSREDATVIHRQNKNEGKLMVPESSSERNLSRSSSNATLTELGAITPTEIAEKPYYEALTSLDIRANYEKDFSSGASIMSMDTLQTALDESQQLPTTLDVKLYYGNRRDWMVYDAHLDTKADGNFISSELLGLLGYEQVAYEGRTFEAVDKEVVPQGTASIYFTIEAAKSQKLFKKRFHVVDGLPYDLLLGVNFIAEYEIFSFNGSLLPLALAPLSSGMPFPPLYYGRVT
ncbi:MAG: hypothetical protein Q9219_001647 [cf. Caloplaca sp. 3 TL-2023]